jgi:hypothetical protein
MGRKIGIKESDTSEGRYSFLPVSFSSDNMKKELKVFLSGRASESNLLIWYGFCGKASA